LAERAAGIDQEIAGGIACLLALFSGEPVTGYTLLILPIGVQEMVLASWLLIKGFTGVAARAGQGQGAHRTDPGGTAQAPGIGQTG
jgi:hypothetical protein